MKQYHDLVRHILDTGTRKENRTGVDTISTFGYYYEHDLRDGFPLLTTKKMSWKNIVIELLWFLSGSNKADFLQRHGCNFWAPWTDDHQVVSNCYGPAWRKFPVHGIDIGLKGMQDCNSANDQIRWLIEELKRNPLSRRMVVSAWAPEVAQKAKLPPCHAMFIVNVQNEPEGTYQESFRVRWSEEDGAFLGTCDRYPSLSYPDNTFAGAMNGIVDLVQKAVAGSYRQRLCLHMTQRSCDTALGVPYNLASYALLMHLLARFSGIEPGIFGHTLVDAHIYTSKPDGSMEDYDHIPGLLEQLKREPRKLPRLHISSALTSLEDVESMLDPIWTTSQIMSLFTLEGYDPHPSIPFKVAV